jgi:hypothetical protein
LWVPVYHIFGRPGFLQLVQLGSTTEIGP